MLTDLSRIMRASQSDRPGTVERAFQLASSGKFAGVSEVRKQLSVEGYPDANAQLAAISLRRQITSLCFESRGLAPRPLPPGRRGKIESSERG